MKLTVDEIQLLKRAPNSAYEVIMPEFLFHSNKLEGSTFTEEELFKLVENGTVAGEHDIDDVYETINSIEAFNYMVDGLGTPVTHEMLFELNRILFQNTNSEKNGFTGHYKTLANRIRNSSVQVALPSDLPAAMDKLFSWWENSSKDFEAIARYHARFEHIHPMQDGNGRIGRILMMKQCLENDVDLIVIDEEYGNAYKQYLEFAQTEGQFDGLYAILHDSQRYFDEKMQQKGIMRMIESMH